MAWREGALWRRPRARWSSAARLCSGAMPRRNQRRCAATVVPSCRGHPGLHFWPVVWLTLPLYFVSGRARAPSPPRPRAILRMQTNARPTDTGNLIQRANFHLTRSLSRTRAMQCSSPVEFYHRPCSAAEPLSSRIPTESAAPVWPTTDQCLVGFPLDLASHLSKYHVPPQQPTTIPTTIRRTTPAGPRCPRPPFLSCARAAARRPPARRSGRSATQHSLRGL